MKLSHALILASDIDKMSQFFIQTLDLKEGLRPPFKFDGIWLYDEMNTACIHIANRNPNNIEQSNYFGLTQASNTITGQPLIDHLAFSAEDYNATKERLIRHEITFIEREIPEQKECQIFLNGPDGIIIEIFFSRIEKH